MTDIEDDGFVTVYDSAGAPRGRVMGHSRVEGAEKAKGHSAAVTGGASDLPCMDYAPDLQAQGDCINCGWAWEYHQ